MKRIRLLLYFFVVLPMAFAVGMGLRVEFGTPARAGVDSNTGNAFTETPAYPVSLTNASVTIATGGTAVTAITAASASAPVHKIIIENTSQNNAVETFSWVGTAGAPGSSGSFVLQPYQFFTTDTDACSYQALSVNSPTTGATATINYN